MGNKRVWALHLSAAAGCAYLFWLGRYILRSGGILWDGIPGWVTYPHMAATMLAVLCTLIGGWNRQMKLLLAGALSYGVAAVLFPPFHVFLLVPLFLIAVWYCGAGVECMA